MRRGRKGLQPGDHPAIAALFGNARRRLLAWLFLHPKEAFYTRQLARIVGGSPGNIPRELARLEHAGILRRTRKGREVFYQANPSSPVFAGLRALFRDVGPGPQSSGR